MKQPTREQVMDAIDDWLDRREPTEKDRGKLRQLIARSEMEPAERSFLDTYVAYLRPSAARPDREATRLARAFLAAAWHAQETSLRGRSLLYAGHALYDNERNVLALPCFRRALCENLDDYLRLKAREFEICCLLRLRDFSGAIETLEEYAQQASTAKPEDIWPSELATLLPTVPTPKKSLFRRLSTRIDTYGNYGAWLAPAVQK